MLFYVLLGFAGCVIGLLLVSIGIIFRKKMELSVMMFIIAFGILMIIGCGIFALACSIPLLPTSLQK